MQRIENNNNNNNICISTFEKAIALCVLTVTKNIKNYNLNKIVLFKTKLRCLKYDVVTKLVIILALLKKL